MRTTTERLNTLEARMNGIDSKMDKLLELIEASNNATKPVKSSKGQARTSATTVKCSKKTSKKDSYNDNRTWAEKKEEYASQYSAESRKLYGEGASYAREYLAKRVESGNKRLTKKKYSEVVKAVAVAFSNKDITKKNAKNEIERIIAAH